MQTESININELLSQKKWKQKWASNEIFYYRILKLTTREKKTTKYVYTYLF